MVGIGPVPATGTGNRLTIAMAPPAIGMVTVQIDRNPDGSSVIAVGATHAATLDQLRNDRSSLDQMLTQAGVPVDQRTVVFHLDVAKADTVGSGQAGVGTGQAGFGGFGAGGGGQGGSYSGSSQHGGGGFAYARTGFSPSGMLDTTVNLADSALPSPIAMRRFGVNVMA